MPPGVYRNARKRWWRDEPLDPRAGDSRLSGGHLKLVHRAFVNIFELSAVAAPLAGTIAGAVSVDSFGAAATLMGAGVGLIIGLAVYLAAVSGSGMLARFLSANASEPLRPLPWLASLTAVLLPMLAPVVAAGLSVFVVARMLHL
jgi:hypothetical protein